MSDEMKRPIRGLDDIFADGSNGGSRLQDVNPERFEWWKPTETPEIVQLIRGNYDVDGAIWPIYPNWEAFIKGGGPKGRGASCHCRCRGGQDKETPCVLHWMLKKDLKAHEGPDGKIPKDFQSTFRPRRQFAITVYRLSYFHKCQVQTTGRDGSTYSRPDIQRCTEDEELVNAAETTCPHCASGVERFFGQRRYMQAGNRYFEALVDIGHHIGEVCSCGSKIVTLGYVCPLCEDRNQIKTVLLDPRNPPAGMSEKDRQAFWKTPTICPTCGKQVKPRAVLKCKGGCETPKPRTIFDVPVCLARQGKDSNSTLVHSGAYMSPVNYDEDMKKLMVPYDFRNMFVVTTQQQAQILGVQDPFLKKDAQVADKDADGPVDEDVPW
jgi:hypothetical protein